MSEKQEVGGVFLSILMMAIVAFIFGPFMLFEANEHSNIKIEYDTTKSGWVDTVEKNVGTSATLTLRDREVARIYGSAHGIGSNAHFETILLQSVPSGVYRDRRYEFHLRCIKVGNLPNPLVMDTCTVLSVKVF